MKKIKTFDSKSNQSKAQNDLDRQTANISVLSSGNAGKYKFLTIENFLQKRLVRKSCYNQKIWKFLIR